MSAYLLWGLFPLYWPLLEPAAPVEEEELPVPGHAPTLDADLVGMVDGEALDRRDRQARDEGHRPSVAPERAAARPGGVTPAARCEGDGQHPGARPGRTNGVNAPRG